MRPGKLSAVKVVALVQAATPGYTADGGNLYLQISKYGTATWAFRYRVGEKLRTVSSSDRSPAVSGASAQSGAADETAA